MIVYIIGVILAWIILKLTDTPVKSRISDIVIRLLISLFSWIIVIAFILWVLIYIIFSAKFWNKNGPKWL